MKKLAFLSIFIAFAISAEDVDNNHLEAENNLMATGEPYVAQDESAPNQDGPPPKPTEECNKCPPKKPSCDKCPPRKPRCQKCPPKKPKCQPKEEPKKCTPPEPKGDN